MYYHVQRKRKNDAKIYENASLLIKNWIGLGLNVVIGFRLTNGIQQWVVGFELEMLMLSADY